MSALRDVYDIDPAPVPAVNVAALVAAEYAAHEAHTRQLFAQDAARTLRAMRPAAHDDTTRAAVAALDASVRVVLMLAGLSPAGSRMVPDAAGCHRTVAAESGRCQTDLNAPERNGTVRNGGER